MPDAVVSFYIASESDHHVRIHDDLLYAVMLSFIAHVSIVTNDNIMLIRQVNSGGVITSDVVLSAVTTESAIEIKLMQQRGGVGTTLFQTANKKEGYKPKVFKITASAIGIDMPVCKNHPECEWNIHTNPWQTDCISAASTACQPSSCTTATACRPSSWMASLLRLPKVR